jgi:hypothetical protein
MRVLQSVLFVAISTLCVHPAIAGVVMSETEVQDGIHGVAALKKTVYVQGKKQKIKTPSQETIIDLDEGRAYVIDSHHRTYVELPFPFPAKGGEASPMPGVKVGTLVLKRTGATREVAGYSCDEYEGAGRMGGLDVMIDQCISAKAPGASELAAFESALSSSLGRRGPQERENIAGGVPLEQRSTIKQARSAEASADRKSETLVASRTRIDHVRVTNLPADTFAPPANFRKILPNGKAETLKV